jgi:hypothetical protein
VDTQVIIYLFLRPEVLVVAQVVRFLQRAGLAILLLHQALPILMLCKVLLVAIRLLEVAAAEVAHQRLVAPIMALMAVLAVLVKHQP